MDGQNDIFFNTEEPSFYWRSSSYQTMLGVASISRLFLLGLNKTEVHGLPGFVNLLKSRSDYRNRRRGLVTVSNHVSVVDDPLIWGVLPFSFAAFHGYMNHRWNFGSHDICFTNTLRSHFFTLGQTLPAHRLAHSEHGGIDQPTMTQGVRLLTKITAGHPTWNPLIRAGHDSLRDFRPSWPRDCVDPFSGLELTPSYPSYPGDDRHYLAPSQYACNSYSWIHIFPEGQIHQSPEKTMRYFKWGVARLILEPPECPDVVPIFIEGTDHIMHEDRGFPRFLPRLGKPVTVTFGGQVDCDAVFGDLRRRWHQLQNDDHLASVQIQSRHYPDTRNPAASSSSSSSIGILNPTLQYGEEAVALRKECALRLRQEVLRLRRERGYPDEDPATALPETWHRPRPPKPVS